MSWPARRCWGYAEAKRLRADPSEVVTLALAAIWSSRTPATFVATLPRYPLRALSLRRHGLRGIPPAVLACRDLEVLSLRRCRLRQPLADGLRGLTKLRAGPDRQLLRTSRVAGPLRPHQP